MPKQPMKLLTSVLLAAALSLTACSSMRSGSSGKIGLGARAPRGAEVIIDGTRKTLDEKWTYWEGPRFGSSLPIKWKIVDDPVDQGAALMSDDPAVTKGKYGVADIVTKKACRDFRL